MKKTMLAVLAVGAAIGLAPPAAADEASFINDLNANGYVESTPGAWLNLGYAACNIGNLQDATTYIYANSDGSVDMADAGFVAESALMFLC